MSLTILPANGSVESENDTLFSDASNCLTCKYYLQSEHCVQNCYPFYYSDAQDVCQQCNEQCRGGCYGPTAEDCTACKNFKVYSDDPEKEKQVSISIIKSFCDIIRCATNLCFDCQNLRLLIRRLT
jgi:hypothetical protein